jgi:hypothetical protein
MFKLIQININETKYFEITQLPVDTKRSNITNKKKSATEIRQRRN